MQFRDIALLLGLPVTERSPAQIEADIRRSLSSGNRRCLWIVDDVPDGFEISRLRSWKGPSPTAKTLITTRSRSYEAVGAALDLSVLSSDDGYDLLTSNRKPSTADEEDAAHLIVAKLGAHPLALDVAGAVLNTTDIVTFSRFLGEFEKADSDVLETGSAIIGVLPTGHAASITATFDRSVRALSPEGRRILLLASILAPVAIPDELISPVVSECSPQETQDPLCGVKAIADVMANCLAERFENPPSRIVHPLVLRTVRFYYSASDEINTLRCAAARVLAKEIPSKLGDARLETILSLYVHHARELCQNVATLDDANLCASLAKFSQYYADLESARSLQARRIDVTVRLLGQDAIETWDGREDAALLSWGDFNRRLELEKELHQILEARRRLQGVTSQKTLMTVWRYCEALRTLGYYAEGRRISHEFYEHCLREAGADDRATLTAQETFASMTIPTDDRMREANKRLKNEIFERRRKLFGDDDEDTVKAALALSDNMDDSTCLYWLRKCYERTLDRHGAQHSNTVDSQVLLAHKLNYSDEAQELMSRALTFYEEHFGLKHPTTTITAHNYRALLRQRDQNEESEDVLRKYLQWLRDEPPDRLTGFVRIIRSTLEPERWAGTYYEPVQPRPYKESWMRRLVRKVLGS